MVWLKNLQIFSNMTVAKRVNLWPLVGIFKNWRGKMTYFTRSLGVNGKTISFFFYIWWRPQNEIKSFSIVEPSSLVIDCSNLIWEWKVKSWCNMKTIRPIPIISQRFQNFWKQLYLILRVLLNIGKWDSFFKNIFWKVSHFLENINIETNGVNTL